MEKEERTMDCFIIDNITERDVRRNILRILVPNKLYFPVPEDENPHIYDITIKAGSVTYDSQYRYNRNISGRLNLREELYRDILKIEHGDILVVVVLEKNEMYQIINLSTLT